MSRIGKGEWIVLYITAGAVDVAQWFADFSGIGAIINEYADPIIGILLAGYFQVRGVSMIRHMDRLLSMIGSIVLEEVTVSVAPAWILDVWYIHASVRKEDAQTAAAKEDEELMNANVRKPMNVGGRREPVRDEDDDEGPRNSIDGIRPARSS